MMQDTMVLEFPMDHNLVASHEKKADRENDRIMHFGMQRKIVSHMTSESWKTIPHVTDQHQGHPDGGRSDHGQRGEDHRVPAEHG